MECPSACNVHAAMESWSYYSSSMCHILPYCDRICQATADDRWWSNYCQYTSTCILEFWVLTYRGNILPVSSILNTAQNTVVRAPRNSQSKYIAIWNLHLHLTSYYSCLLVVYMCYIAVILVCRCGGGGMLSLGFYQLATFQYISQLLTYTDWSSK